MPSKRNESPLTPSAVLQQRLPELRLNNGWSQTALAARMKAYGHKWVRSTIAKIERGERQVSVDELFALSWVLGVSPVALVVPQTTATVRVAGPDARPTQTDSTLVWRWLNGDYPMGGGLPGETPSNDVIEGRRRRYEDACPTFIVEAERQLPGLRKVRSTLASIQSAWNRPTVDRKERDHHVLQLLEDAEADIKHLFAGERRRQMLIGDKK